MLRSQGFPDDTIPPSSRFPIGTAVHDAPVPAPPAAEARRSLLGALSAGSTTEKELVDFVLDVTRRTMAGGCLCFRGERSEYPW